MDIAALSSAFRTTPAVSTCLYRVAAHALASTVLRAPWIESVCVRRSVASGEASFPFSDLDLDITLPETSGPTIHRLLQRLRIARVLFPRTGQCFVLGPGELDELAATEPYRASINRRCGLTVRGPTPVWPEAPLGRLETARRVVFWLDSYFPWSVRGSYRRHQRKFFLEMGNALGILEGRWELPQVRLGDVATAYRLPSDGFFRAGLAMAGSAHRLLGRSAPHLRETVTLPGLTLLPTPDTPWRADAIAGRGPVVTPAALDLLLQTQSPALWFEHGPVLTSLGFEPPSAWTWVRFARRTSGVLWLRGAGFFEPSPQPARRRIRLAEHILDSIERRDALPPEPPREALTSAGTGTYYRHDYAELACRASSLRHRARLLEDRLPLPSHQEASCHFNREQTSHKS